MPVVSRFFGIVVIMHWRDHRPPHFHAKYGDEEVAVDLATGEVTGTMNRRALALLEEWRLLHVHELAADWRLAEQRRPLNQIIPLE
jgi:hypothetical protein